MQDQLRRSNSVSYSEGNLIGADLSNVLMGYVSHTLNSFLGVQCLTTNNNLKPIGSMLRPNEPLSCGNENKEYTEDEFLCPITQDTMKSPVLSRRCGHTFERGALFRWLDKNSNCPLCKSSMAKSDMMSNYSLKRVIDKKRKDKRDQ